MATKQLAVGETPVTFITPEGPMEIRMRRNAVNDICAAAATLKASHFVTQDGFDKDQNLPIWGVFDMRKAQRDTPMRGEWSISDPIRTFVMATTDAAVMFAVHRSKR